MPRLIHSLVAVGLASLALGNGLPVQAAQPWYQALVHDNRTPGLANAARIGPSDPNRLLSVAVTLDLRNRDALQQIIEELGDPSSPNYAHYLTPAQFTARFGPTDSQVTAVSRYLQAGGLRVTRISANHTIVDATGTVGAIDSAFHVTIADWFDRVEHRRFFGNDTQPSLPSSIASMVLGIAGLNDHYPFHRTGAIDPLTLAAPPVEVNVAPAHNPPPAVRGEGRVGGSASAASNPALAPRVRGLTPSTPPGHGVAGGYTPADLKLAYNVSGLAASGYAGQTQSLGLFEMDGFQQANISTYDAQYRLATTPPLVHLIDGVTGVPGSSEIEVELDIEVMHAFAPGAVIQVWETPNSDPGSIDAYNDMVTSDITNSNSTSWGQCELYAKSTMATLDNIFAQAAAQGMSFFAASGDTGSYDCTNPTQPNPYVDYPASDPYMTGVGGTSLTVNADGSYQGETGWWNGSRGVGAGGGVSQFWAQPIWQKGAGVPSNPARLVPDIALDADPLTGYSVFVTDSGACTNATHSCWIAIGGTSGGAPGWAAITALFNQYRALHSARSMGYANPVLYGFASAGVGPSPYHDITSGSNLTFACGPGWDALTGLGTPNVGNLVIDRIATAWWATPPKAPGASTPPSGRWYLVPVH